MKDKLFIILLFLPILTYGQFPAHNWNDCPKNDIAHPMDFLTHSGASVSEKIGTMNYNRNHPVISSIAYSMITDTSSLFAINSDSLYFTSVTGLQKFKTYWIQFKVTDGSISDTADGYIYVADEDSCVAWSAKYENFDEGYYYTFLRGLTYSLTDTIKIDADNVTLMAIGNGIHPILNVEWTSGSKYLFRLDNDGGYVYGLEINKNNNAYCDYVYRTGYGVDNLTFNQNRYISVNGLNTGWNQIYRHDQDIQVYNHKIHDEYVCGNEGSVGWYWKVTNMEVIGCHFDSLGCDDGVWGDGDCTSDGFHWPQSDAGLWYSDQRDVRYNKIDHSAFGYKHGIVMGSKEGYVCWDTIVSNWIIGPGVKNGSLSYPFNAITIEGQSQVYIARNRDDSCEVSFFSDELDPKNILYENNISFGARKYGMVFVYNPDSSKFLHNTYVNPAFSDVGYVITGGLDATDTLANNIFYLSDGQTLYQAYDVIRLNNLYYDTTGTNYGGHEGTNEIFTNPDLTNISNYDVTLQSGSPAINAGYNFGVVYDFAGNIRDATPDIGAYEYQGENGGGDSEERVYFKKNISRVYFKKNGSRVYFKKY